MASTFVNALFVISVFLPPAVVVVGLVLLAWPRKHERTTVAASMQAHAH